MKNVTETNGLSFHGEVGIIRADLLGITELPADAKEIKPENGKHLVAHSESGFHHYVDAVEARFYSSDNPNVCYLKISGEVAYLKHLKPSSDPDTHGTQALKSGVSDLYIIHKQREETPEGWRRVQD